VRNADAVVVGSGLNGLVAAAYLARAGWDVELVERSDRLGGAIVTEELTLPGFRHDSLSAWHPLFQGSAAWAELGEELGARGVEYRNTDRPTGVAYGDGRALVAGREPADTAAGFSPADAATFLREIDGFDTYGAGLGALLGQELHSGRSAATAARMLRGLGRRGATALGAFALRSAGDWLESTFDGPEPGLLYAPWALHTGQAPSTGGGAIQLLPLIVGLHLGGMPVVAGGSDRLVLGLRRLIEDHGGVVRTGVDVERIVVRGGRAVGVHAGGEETAARRAVVASVTPTQLYGRLLDAGAGVAEPVRASAARYRYGRAAMQIHLALRAPLRWPDERLDGTAVVHVADGPRAIDLACAQARAGLLPSAPTVVVGQPTTMDPTRAPDGAAVLWIQLQEVPYRVLGDAAGEIDVPADGRWTPELAAAYADRVVGRVAAHVPGLRDAILGRAILTPEDIERYDVNLVHGDPYAGATDLDQLLLWRPLDRAGSHRTPVDGLWQIGASTHPGPGLNPASGHMVAQALIDGGVGARLGRRLRGGTRRR
jgi:phytoene dehydrogenase-like protein